MSNLDYFAFHCQYGYLNDALKDFLFSLEVPCPKFLKTFEVLPPWDDERNLALRRSMWHFIRTMSREVSSFLFINGFSKPLRILIPLDGFMKNI